MQNSTQPERGTSLSFRKTMTVAEQAMYSGISVNLAQMHVDAAAARAAGFGNMLSFELAVLSLATTGLNRLAGPAWRIGSLDMKFDAPVTVGSTIDASVTVTEADAQAIRFDVVCTIDGGAQAIRGHATMLPLVAAS
jgi:3-hydroxybutyryl-CoA dehydratase